MQPAWDVTLSILVFVRVPSILFACSVIVLGPGIGPNDIALVKLPYALHLTETVNAVCLSDDLSLFQEGDVCTTVGWGISETGYSKLTLTVLVTTIDALGHFVLKRIITAQWEGMGGVGLARYGLTLLPKCPTIRFLNYCICQRSTHK